MILIRENLEAQIKKAVKAEQKVISISLTDNDIAEIFKLSKDKLGNYDINAEEVLFGYPLIKGANISTINVALHDDHVP